MSYTIEKKVKIDGYIVNEYYKFCTWFSSMHSDETLYVAWHGFRNDRGTYQRTLKPITFENKDHGNEFYKTLKRRGFKLTEKGTDDYKKTES